MRPFVRDRVNVACELSRTIEQRQSLGPYEMVCVDNEKADPKSKRRQPQRDKEGDYYGPSTK